jgi:hypothetical protein
MSQAIFGVSFLLTARLYLWPAIAPPLLVTHLLVFLVLARRRR